MSFTVNDLFGNSSQSGFGNSSFASPRSCGQSPCPVCFDRKSEKDFIKHQICSHKQCKSCFTRYLKISVPNIEAYPIKCHIPSCKRTWNLAFLDKFMSKNLTKDERKKFNRFHDKAVNGMEYLDCGNCQTETRVNPEKGPIFNCRKCRQFICYKCRRSHDSNMTCEEIMTAEQGKAEKQMERFKKTVSVVACPRCKFDIMRKSGCREMSHECAGHAVRIHFCGYCATILNPKKVRYELKTEIMHFPEGTMNPCIKCTPEQANLI